MKKFLLFSLIVIFLVCCTNKKHKAIANPENRVAIRSDILNVIKLSDTLIIYESTCRGCAYEKSTHFDISDSLDLIKLHEVITTDNNPQDMDGGSIRKELILIPVKTGMTVFKLYKFWGVNTAEDSAAFTPYRIEVQN